MALNFANRVVFADFLPYFSLKFFLNFVSLNFIFLPVPLQLLFNLLPSSLIQPNGLLRLLYLRLDLLLRNPLALREIPSDAFGEQHVHILLVEVVVLPMQHALHFCVVIHRHYLVPLAPERFRVLTDKWSLRSVMALTNLGQWGLRRQVFLWGWKMLFLYAWTWSLRWFSGWVSFFLFFSLLSETQIVHILYIGHRILLFFNWVHWKSVLQTLELFPRNLRFYFCIIIHMGDQGMRALLVLAKGVKQLSDRHLLQRSYFG